MQLAQVNLPPARIVRESKNRNLSFKGCGFIVIVGGHHKWRPQREDSSMYYTSPAQTRTKKTAVGIGKSGTSEAGNSK